MTGGLDGLTTLVTGGGSGIGRAAVDAYLAAGARVTVVERNRAHADELAAQHDGLPLALVVGDATDPAVLQQAAELAGPQLGHLTCCVGVFDQYASLRDMAPTDLIAASEEIWRLNVLSSLLAVSVALPALTAYDGTSSITLTVSESAFHPVGGGVLYGSSKWALRGAVMHLASDLAPDVRVNGVAPGGTSGTRFGGLRSLRQTSTADVVDGRDERIAAGSLLGTTPNPEDHGSAYAWLADPVAARIVTGVVLNTDGGRRM